MKIVIMGERTYEVRPLTIKANRRWRGQIEEPLSQLMDVISGGAFSDIQNVEGLVAAVRLIATRIINAPDVLWEQVKAYVPEIAADAEWLEENATDAEVVAAFVAVLGVVFPLEGLMRFLGPVKRPT